MKPGPRPGLEGLSDHTSRREAREVLQEIAAELQPARSVFLTSHVNPDGDALGSEGALALALETLGKRVRVVNGDQIPRKLRDLVPGRLYDAAPEGWLPDPGEFDWAVVLDTSEPERLGTVRPAVFSSGQKRLCIDHHRHDQEGVYDHHLVVVDAPATGSIVLELIDLLGVPLSREIAQSLWVALATDTGWFRFSNTTPWALEQAARLVSTGLSPESMYEALYGTQSFARARLLGELLGELQAELGGSLTWACVRRDARVRHSVELSELDGIIDTLRTVGEPQVVALIVELEEQAYKVSLRSLGAVSVQAVARVFGGGGHTKAAGYRYRGALEALVADLCTEVERRAGSEPERRQSCSIP